MITVGSKNKVLLFDVSTEGIARENLEFWFRIYNEDVTYSFRGELTEDNKVKVVVYPLTEMVNNIDISKIYPANLEVIGEGKYYIKTWEGELKVESSPKVDIKLEKMSDEEIKKPVLEETKKVVVNSIIEEQEEEIEKPKEFKEEPEEIKTEEKIVNENEETPNNMRYSSLLEDVLKTNSVKKGKPRKSVDILAELK